MKPVVRQFRADAEDILRDQQEADPTLNESTEPYWLAGRLYERVGSYPTLIEDLRQMWRETFAEVPTHSPELMRDMRLRAPAVENAVREIVAEKIREKIQKGDAVALSLIFATWNIEIEGAYSVVSHAYFRGFCPLHRTERITRPDGQFDAICGPCEDEMMEGYYEPEISWEPGDDDVAH